MKTLIKILILLFFIKSNGQFNLKKVGAIMISVSVKDYKYNNENLSRDLYFNENGKLNEEILYNLINKDSLIINELNQNEYDNEDKLVKSFNWIRKCYSCTFDYTFSNYTYDEDDKLKLIENYNSESEIIQTTNYSKKENSFVTYISDSDIYYESVFDNQNRKIEDRARSRETEKIIWEKFYSYDNSCISENSISYYDYDNPLKEQIIKCYDNDKKLVSSGNTNSKKKYQYNDIGFLNQIDFYEKSKKNEGLELNWSNLYIIKKINIVPNLEVIKKVNTFLLEAY